MGRKGGRHNFRTNNKPFKVPVDHVKHKGNFADGLQKAGLNVTGAVAMVSRLTYEYLGRDSSVAPDSAAIQGTLQLC